MNVTITVVAPDWRCRVTLPDGCAWAWLWPDGTYYINGAVNQRTVGTRVIPALGLEPKDGK